MGVESIAELGANLVQDTGIVEPERHLSGSQIARQAHGAKDDTEGSFSGILSSCSEGVACCDNAARTLCGDAQFL
ncbi:hypothetical protein D3C80_830690 [compost metagenome]